MYESGHILDVERIVVKKFLTTLLTSSLLAGSAVAADLPQAGGVDILDPTPVSQQQAAVDGVNFKFSVLGGAFQRNDIGTAGNYMFVGSVSAPLFSNSFGIQIDGGIGLYDDDFTSAAGGLHLFWRDPSRGLIGIYGDWAYVGPEHAGRVGGEFAVYNDRWSLDVFAGIQFGQHVFTEFVDEVDLSYYFTDNTKGSIGHRLTSRGHVGNISFEHLVTEGDLAGFSVFGELEAGEDNYVAGWGGVRYSFGTGSWNTLIERDRQGDPIVRIPRNIASVSQCGRLDTPIPETSLRAEITTLCASEDEINSRSSTGIEKITGLD